MSKLRQLLSYLDRSDVAELVFRVGDRGLLHTGTRAHPVTVTPLRPEQIHRFFQDTEVVQHLPGSDPGDGGTHRLALLGQPYQVSIRGDSRAFEVRVRLAPAIEASMSGMQTPSDEEAERAKRPTREDLRAVDDADTPPPPPSSSAVPLHERTTRHDLRAMGSDEAGAEPQHDSEAVPADQASSRLELEDPLETQARTGVVVPAIHEDSAPIVLPVLDEDERPPRGP